MSRSVDQHLPLPNLSFHVLLALGDRVSHGYAIGKEVEERSNGRLRPTTGALYQALRRLEEDGLVAPAERPADDNGDARRKYFRLTSLGRDVVAAEAERLSHLVEVARSKQLMA